LSLHGLRFLSSGAAVPGRPFVQCQGALALEPAGALRLGQGAPRFKKNGGRLVVFDAKIAIFVPIFLGCFCNPLTRNTRKRKKLIDKKKKPKKKVDLFYKALFFPDLFVKKCRHVFFFPWRETLKNPTKQYKIKQSVGRFLPGLLFFGVSFFVCLGESRPLHWLSQWPAGSCCHPGAPSGRPFPSYTHLFGYQGGPLCVAFRISAGRSTAAISTTFAKKNARKKWICFTKFYKVFW
jgi:hypothetical protein